MEKYCKAYHVERFEEFPGWGKRNVSDGDKEPVKYLYLHQDYTVTDGIFTGENVVFDDVTPEWVEFCKSVLKFEVPVYESASAS
jgi:hypothetical protein